MTDDNIKLWNEASEWWQREFTEGADEEYVEQIIPLFLQHLGTPTSLLDVGTGEGQMARLAAKAGVARVVGIDPTERQIAVARERASGPEYRVASAESLPFEEGEFDAALVCLAFEHMPDIAKPIVELGRVVRPGGTLLLFLNHPLLQAPGSGWIDDHILDEQYWRVGSYREERRTVEEVEKGVFIPFFHRPLSMYLNGLIAAGFALRRVEEPAPPSGFVERADEYEAQSSIPRLLFLGLER